MRNYSNSSLTGLVLKAILALILIVIVVTILKNIIAIVASLLFLAFIVVGLLAGLRYLSRTRTRF